MPVYIGYTRSFTDSVSQYQSFYRSSSVDSQIYCATTWHIANYSEYLPNLIRLRMMTSRKIMMNLRLLGSCEALFILIYSTLFPLFLSISYLLLDIKCRVASNGWQQQRFGRSGLAKDGVSARTDKGTR